ncbi:cation:proton antiporter [Marinilabilia salmonicolor]|jgi:Kef-type K+ transport system membrane component KefB|uniref:Transporter (CPA2 family) n=1 Tax=Marinilabilia salmonicolor TaxID=989 RepID=A0A368V8C5_9BACT|nr:cation:proton antiporter [Marinilabilia salmonicolor]RCW35241.1 transporter (CPA2 family) [Marinilabilia salmonicolor]
MSLLLITGIIIFSGFLLGELAARISLPKISGYIIAGILLNPQVLGIVPHSFIETGDPLVNISLAVITFHIGGSLSFDKIRKEGKNYLIMTLAESLLAYLFVFLLTFLTVQYVFNLFDSIYLALAFSMLLASLAAPTDPSATLAVIEEYKASGPVSSSVLGIAAFDDIMGIILFTLSLASAKVLLGDGDTSMLDSMGHLFYEIGVAVLLGAAFGFLLNRLSSFFKKETDGALIVLILGILIACYGTATYIGVDELLSTLALGVVVINYNKQKDEIFGLIERYTEELIFVIFFTLSGLHLDISLLSGNSMLILLFIAARLLGKYTGIWSSSLYLSIPKQVKKYTAGGLLPQGGIVIGLALLVSKEEAFNAFSILIMTVVIGTAIIHELFGPVISKLSLKNAGEIEDEHRKAQIQKK